MPQGHWRRTKQKRRDAFSEQGSLSHELNGYGGKDRSEERDSLDFNKN